MVTATFIISDPCLLYTRLTEHKSTCCLLFQRQCHTGNFNVIISLMRLLCSRFTIPLFMFRLYD
jgi:hypothetical protein